MSEARVGESSERSRIIRTIIGLLCAPLVGAVMAMFAAFMALQLINGQAFGIPVDQIMPLLQMGAMLGAYAGWPVAFLFGWPIHVGLMQRNASKAPYYVLFGAFIATATFVVATTVTGYLFRFILDWQFILTGLSFLTAGAIGGLVFWLIRRPDRDNQSALPTDSPLDEKA